MEPKLGDVLKRKGFDSGTSSDAKKKQKAIECSISTQGTRVTYEWNYESLKGFEIDLWLKFLAKYKANDLFPHGLSFRPSSDPSISHTASFERCRSSEKEEYHCFWEWKHGSFSEGYNPFSVPFTAYIRKWESEKFQYVPLQHMVMVEERGFCGNRHNFFDRCRIYLAFVRFLRRAPRSPELFSWMTWQYKADWNRFMETLFSKLWIYFAPPEYLYSCDLHRSQRTDVTHSKSDGPNGTTIEIAPWTKNCWNMDKSLYYGWVDPMDWNHLGLLRFMESDPNLMDPNQSPTSKKPSSSHAHNKKEENPSKLFSPQDSFVDDPRNNAPYLFFLPKFSVIPFWSERDFNVSVKLTDKDRLTLIEKIAKEFGKHIFRLVHSPIMLNNDFTSSIKIFKNMDRMVRYCTEPVGYIHMSVIDMEEMETILQSTCDWIQANPHWPEMEWISIKQYKQQMKAGDCIAIDGRDLQQIHKLIQQIECFGSDRSPKIRSNDSVSIDDGIDLIANLPCGLLICGGEPQGLKIAIKMQHSVLSIRSIFSISIEGLSNTMRLIENFEESVERYWRTIDSFSRNHRKSYQWFSRKVQLWKTFLSEWTNVSFQKDDFCLPLVSLDRWNAFLRIKDEQELQTWLSSSNHVFFRYEKAIESNSSKEPCSGNLERWMAKVKTVRDPEELSSFASRDLRQKFQRFPPWIDCPKTIPQEPKRPRSKRSALLKSSLLCFESLQEDGSNASTSTDEELASSRSSKKEEGVLWSERRWKHLERTLKMREIGCFFPGAFLNHTYQGIPSATNLWIHVLYPMMFNSTGKIQTRDTEFSPRFDPTESIKTKAMSDLYRNSFDSTEKMEKIWNDWINSIQDDVYFESWNTDALNQKEEDARMIWELCFWLIMVYDHLVYTTPLWKLKGPGDWWQDYLSSFKKSSKNQNPRILPIGWKGGDTFVVLVGLMTGSDVESIRDIVEHPYFQIWKRENDLTRCYQLGIKEHEFTTFYPKEKRHQATLFEGRQLLKNNIVLSSTWKDDLSVDSCLHIISTITKSLKFPDYQIFCDRAMNSIPFRIQSTQNKLDDGEGRGVEQQCITMYWESIERLKMFDWFDFFKVTKKDVPVQEQSKEEKQIDSKSEQDPSSSKAEKTNKNNNKLEQMLPKLFVSKENSHHAYVLGFLLNYCLLHEIKFHLNQPPMFWKLISFRPELEPFQIQDYNDMEPEYCKTKFETFFWNEKTMEECLDFGSLEDQEMNSFGSIPVNKNTIHLYLRAEMRDFIKRKVPGVASSSLRDGFFTTSLDYRPTYRILYNYFYDPWRENLTGEMIIKSLKLVVTPSLSGMKHANCIQKLHVTASNNSICPASALVRFLHSLDQKGLKKFLNFVTGSPLFGCVGDSYIYVRIHESNQDKYPESRTCGRLLELTSNLSRMFASVEESYEFHQSRLSMALESGPSFPMI